jgi:hypothetical protein
MIRLEDMPERLEGPAAWLGAEMAAAPERWLVELSPEDIADLEQAAAHFLALGRDVGEITAAAFPLGPFAARRRAERETAPRGWRRSSARFARRAL